MLHYRGALRASYFFRYNVSDARFTDITPERTGKKETLLVRVSTKNYGDSLEEAASSSRNRHPGKIASYTSELFTSPEVKRYSRVRQREHFYLAENLPSTN